MNSETKTCQNCKTQFTVEPDDFAFYEKIKVPPPTWCPDCRLMRKMARRDERTLYKRICNLCKREMISMYDKKSPFVVYCNDCWWGDDWDASSYGVEYDFNKNFFDQFYALSLKVPRIALFQKGNINSPYTNHADHNKNCYLAYNSGFIEDSMYSKWGIKSKDIFDCYGVHYSENIRESQSCERCSNCAYLSFSYDCLDSAFLFNCKGCSRCFLSSNLRTRSYVFANEQLSKEEYQNRMSKINLGDRKILEEQIKRFHEEILPKTIYKYALVDKIVNSTGNDLYACKNVRNSFHVSEAEDCAYCTDNLGLKDSFDTYEAGFNCELQYDSHACNRTSSSMFCSACYDNHHLQYCEMCHGSSDLFGCIGIRNKQFFILNKQYEKNGYNSLLIKIIEQMKSVRYTDKVGKTYGYGEFFPVELSPFAYNETVAQEYFPLTHAQVVEQKYNWKEVDARDYKITKTADNFSADIHEIDDSIVDEIIECSHKGACNEQCASAFRIVPNELQFYRKMNLPIPVLCPNCRHYARLKQRNPLKLWHRPCMCDKPDHQHAGKCPNEFETSYAPERPEIVYCEQCYNAEVA